MGKASPRGASRLPSTRRSAQWALQATSTKHVLELQTQGDAIAQSEGIVLSDLLVNNATAQDVRRVRPPTASGTGPLPVSISLTVTNMFAIEETTQTYKVEGQVVLQWKDPRLAMPAGVTRVQLQEGEVWTPAIDFYNEIGDLHLPATKDALLGAAGHALLTHTMRFVGEFAMRMNFRYYPGDKHALPVEIELFGNPSDAVFFNSSQVNIMDGAVASSVWTVDQIVWRIDDVLKPSTGLSYSRLVVNLNTSRVISAYLVNLFLPVLLMLVITWLTFFIDPRAVPARAGLTITSLLVSYTFYNHVQTDLPTTGYFTFTDLYCVFGIIGGVGALLCFIRVHWLLRLASDNKPPDVVGKTIDFKSRAEWADATCRLMFPVYILFCVTFAMVPLIMSGQSNNYDPGDIQ